MADNKKYYYLKLKADFFDSDEIVLLESITDGYLYSSILLKLYLKSLKFRGKLMFSERIPYNPDILSKITRHNVGVIEKALKIFKELGLIEVLDNGAIYMLDIQNFIGKSSTEADRKRSYREMIEKDKGQMSLKCPDKTTPEIDIDIDIDIDKEIDIENNLRSKKERREFSDNDKEYKLANYLSKQISERLDRPLQTEKILQNWSNEFEKMVRLDKIDIEDIKKVLIFSQQDDFWQTNILSAGKFRKQYLQLLSKMKKGNNNPKKQSSLGSLLEMIEGGTFDE